MIFPFNIWENEKMKAVEREVKWKDTSEIYRHTEEQPKNEKQQITCIFIIHAFFQTGRNTSENKAVTYAIKLFMIKLT